MNANSYFKVKIDFSVTRNDVSVSLFREEKYYDTSAPLKVLSENLPGHTYSGLS